jgi:hypothetical protein
MAWTTWIPTAIAFIMASILLAARYSIKAGIERSIQHKFEAKLETLRAELQMHEEEQKSALRFREAEINALRDIVLSGRAHRQSLLDKRRLEAVERLWTAVVQLSPYKFVSASMAIIKVEAVAKEASRNPALRDLFGTITRHVPTQPVPEYQIYNERPFVSPKSWAFFSAYYAIVKVAHLRTESLKNGVDPADVVDTIKVKDLLKAVLPHQTTFVDKYDIGAAHYLLEEIEDSLLSELRRTLDGGDIDDADLAQSAKIMQVIQTALGDRMAQLEAAAG